MSKAAESPAFLPEKLCEEELAEASRLLSRVVGELDEILVEEGRASDAAETHSGGQNLGEAVYAKNTAVDVHRKEGGNKRFRKLSEEVIAGRVNILGAIELEEVVRV